MKTLRLVVAAAFVAYILAWTAFYISYAGADFSYYFEYLRLAWTSPGESVAVLQIYSLGASLFCAAATLAFILLRKPLG